MSHYNYLVKKYEGKLLYVNGGCLHKLIENDIVTGNPIEFKDWSMVLWKCTEVQLVESDSKYVSPELYLIIKHDSMTVYINESYLDEEKMRHVWLKSEWDKLVSKYGYTMVKTAFEHSIRVGMPEKLLLYSRGEPKKINRASYGSQWCYSSMWSAPYVYVKGGKVTGWN